MNEDDTFSKKRRNLLFICVVIILYALTHATINDTAFSVVKVPADKKAVLEWFGVVILLYFMYRYYIALRDFRGNVKTSFIKASLNLESVRSKLIKAMKQSVAREMSIDEELAIKTSVRIYTSSIIPFLSTDFRKLKTVFTNQNLIDVPTCGPIQFNAFSIKFAKRDIFLTCWKILWIDSNVVEYLFPVIINVAAFLAIFYRAICW